MIFYRSLFFFLLTLLVPIGIMTFLYLNTIRNIQENTYNQYLTAMKSSANTIEDLVDSKNDLAFNILSNRYVAPFFVIQNPSVNPVAVRDIFESQIDLHAFIQSNRSASGIQLFSKYANVLIDSNTSTFDFERYYGQVFKFGDYSMQEWIDNVLLQQHSAKIYPARYIRYGITNRRRITVARSVPFSSQHRFYGNIFIFIDEAELFRPFDAIPYHDNGMLAILDAQGEFISYNQLDEDLFSEIDMSLLTDYSGFQIQRLGGERMFILYWISANTNWQYITVVPLDVILADTIRLRNFNMFLIVFAIFVGSALAIGYAHRTSRPLRTIYQRLANYRYNIKLNDIADEISALIRNNTDMQNTIKQQLPAQKTAFFYSLLTGGFQDTEEVLSNFQKIGMPLKGEMYAVIIVILMDIDTNLGVQESVAYNEICKELIVEHLPSTIGFASLSFERFAFLTVSETVSESSFRDFLEHATKDIIKIASRKFQMELHFTAGIVHDILEIPILFRTMNLNSSYSISSVGGEIEWFDDNSSLSQYGVTYPFELESRLILDTKKGNTVAVFSILNAILKHNQEILSNSSGAAYKLIQALYATLQRVLNELPAGNNSILQKSSRIAIAINAQEEKAYSIFIKLQESFALLATIFAQTSISGNTLKVQILEYLEDEYANPQISLSSVASHFRISEVYLSRIFKQITGETFSKYVEKLRMDKAKVLIRAGNHSVSEVALLVGYNSPQVFRRAYKRHFNTLPSESQREKK